MNKHICEKKQSIYMALKSSAEFFPKHTALIYFNKSFSYSYLLKRVNQFAFALKEIGVKKDDLVTICLPNIPEAVYLLYAINQLGAIANIVHPLFTYEQMEESLNVTKSKYLFALDSKFDDFKKFILKGINVHFVKPAHELNIFKRFGYAITHRKDKIPTEYTLKGFYHAPILTSFDERYECDAIYLHSGGTTGKSKIVALSSFALNSLVSNGPWFINRDSCEKVGMLSTLPMFHGFGLCIGIHIALSDGGYDVLMPKFSAKETIKYIKHNKIHILVGVPLLYEALCNKEEFSTKHLKNLLIAWVGGDFIPNSLIEKFNAIMIKNDASCRLRPGYGLTETVNVCAVNSVSEFKDGSVGRPLPNVKFKVVDLKTRKEVGLNIDGELLVSGETLMNGYRFEDESSNKDAFIKIGKEKYVLTGDICSIDEDGYLYFKSRIKNVIKVNGIPVFPSEIEQTVSSFKYIWEVAATSVSDKKHGSLIKLFVVFNRKMDVNKETALKEIEEKIVATHGVYAKPIDIVVLERMPHTMVTKIDYNALKEML